MVKKRRRRFLGVALVIAFIAFTSFILGVFTVQTGIRAITGFNVQVIQQEIDVGIPQELHDELQQKFITELGVNGPEYVVCLYGTEDPDREGQLVVRELFEPIMVNATRESVSFDPCPRRSDTNSLWRNIGITHPHFPEGGCFISGEDGRALQQSTLRRATFVGVQCWEDFDRDDRIDQNEYRQVLLSLNLNEPEVI